MHILISLAISFSKGLLLGGSAFVIGWCMDRTISQSSRETIIQKDEIMYEIGQQAVITNLLIITPVIYTFVDQSILSHEDTFSIFSFLGLIIFQNVSYFFIHREMHRNPYLLWMHRFHHYYDFITIPSAAHIVSTSEFIIGYVSPMVAGAYIIKPTEVEFVSATEIITLFNLLLHTYELNNVKWIPGFVSPTQHIEHHRIRNKHYAAPLLNVDEYFYYLSEYMLKHNKNT